MAVTQLNANGSVDTSFGTNGKLLFGVGSAKSFVKAVAVQPNGKILLGGYTWNNVAGDFVVVRLNADGSFDNTFGTNGVKVLDDGKDEVLSALKLLPNGKILASGYVNDNFAMALLNEDGTIDNTFGVAG